MRRYGWSSARATGDHPSCLRILECVRREPGLSFRGLVRASGIPSGTCRHHLTVLMRAGKLREVRFNRRLAYFPPSVRRHEELLHLVQREGLEETLEAIRLIGPCTQTQLVDSLPAKRSTTQHRVRRLVAMGAVRERRHPRTVFYEVAA